MSYIGPKIFEKCLMKEDMRETIREIMIILFDVNIDDMEQPIMNQGQQEEPSQIIPMEEPEEDETMTWLKYATDSIPQLSESYPHLSHIQSISSNTPLGIIYQIPIINKNDDEEEGNFVNENSVMAEDDDIDDDFEWFPFFSLFLSSFFSSMKRSFRE